MVKEPERTITFSTRLRGLPGGFPTPAFCSGKKQDLGIQNWSPTFSTAYLSPSIDRRRNSDPWASRSRSPDGYQTPDPVLPGTLHWSVRRQTALPPLMSLPAPFLAGAGPGKPVLSKADSRPLEPGHSPTGISREERESNALARRFLNDNATLINPHIQGTFKYVQNSLLAETPLGRFNLPAMFKGFGVTQANAKHLADAIDARLPFAEFTPSYKAGGPSGLVCEFPYVGPQGRAGNLQVRLREKAPGVLRVTQVYIDHDKKYLAQPLPRLAAAGEPPALPRAQRHVTETATASVRGPW